MPTCAICNHLGFTPQAATGTVGLLTAEASLINAAVDRFVIAGPEQHVVVNACPEHVVDVYRGRIDGVKMAWRLGDSDAASLSRRNPATASASPV